VALYGREHPTLWRLRVDAWFNGGMPAFNNNATMVTRMAVVGARGNSARYFQHYYRDGEPIETLKILAAQIVLAGHEVDRLIDGLDLALIRCDKFTLLEDHENKSLCMISREIEAFIRKRLQIEDAVTE
jgi:hypothetical protein